MAQIQTIEGFDLGDLGYAGIGGPTEAELLALRSSLGGDPEDRARGIGRRIEAALSAAERMGCCAALVDSINALTSSYRTWWDAAERRASDAPDRETHGPVWESIVREVVPLAHLKLDAIESKTHQLEVDTGIVEEPFFRLGNPVMWAGAVGLGLLVYFVAKR